MRYLSQSPEETKAIAAKILPGLTTNVIALHGPLGAGKTTFTQGIAQSLGVTQRVISPTFILLRQYPVAHPLLQLHQSEYPALPRAGMSRRSRQLGGTRDAGVTQPLGGAELPGSEDTRKPRASMSGEASYNSIYHLDLYRVEGATDLKSVELEEIIADPKNLVVIEWAEKAKAVLPRKRLDVSFTIGKENQRSLTISHKQ